MTFDEYVKLKPGDLVWVPAVVPFSRVYGTYNAEEYSDAERYGEETRGQYQIYDWWASPHLVEAVFKKTPDEYGLKLKGYLTSCTWHEWGFFLTKKECDRFIQSRLNRRLARLETYNGAYEKHGTDYGRMGADMLARQNMAVLQS